MLEKRDVRGRRRPVELGDGDTRQKGIAGQELGAAKLVDLAVAM
jgi:hypothetical protein